MKTSDGKNIFINNAVVFRDIHSVYLLINTKEKYYADRKAVVQINETGKEIWKSIETARTEEEVIEKILKLYNLADDMHETLKADAESFISALLRLGYLYNE